MAGPATGAALNTVAPYAPPPKYPTALAPAGIAIDAAGNLYIADTGNARIRKVDLKGIITTIAGTGEAGFAGDGGRAKSAQLSSPAGWLLTPPATCILPMARASNLKAAASARLTRPA